MSFLAPLYMLGMLLVSLPVLAHLLQRRTRRLTRFSSLMFLEESPPKITRRSRLSNLLLLALRAVVITLLSFAFARPLLRDFRQVYTELPSRRVAILVDQSASMRQKGVWIRTQKAIEEVLEGLAPHDDVALFTFDEYLHTIVPPGERSQLPQPQQISNIRQAITELQPSWYGTKIGPAFSGLIEEYQSSDITGHTHALNVVVISDLQVGMDLNAVANVPWPEKTCVDIRNVGLASGNAFAQPLPAEDDSTELRLRVVNSERSQRKPLTLVTRTANREKILDSLPIQVLPGRSRVITLDHPTKSFVVMLEGDEETFDNETFIAVGRPVTKTVLYVGDHRDTPGSMYYFLRRTHLGSRLFPVQIQVHETRTVPELIDPQNTPLVIFSGLPPVDWKSILKTYLYDGGRLLVTLDAQRLSDDKPHLAAPCLASLLKVDQLEFEYVEVADHAMWSEVDFANEIFQPFAQPGFNDFTKIRFWKYWRPVTNHEQPWTVIARFENQVPALVQREFGPGRLWIMTTGWARDTSQLALSTKFIPLLVGFLGEVAHGFHQDRRLHVGQAIDLSKQAALSVTDPNGRMTKIRGEERYRDTDTVGFYTIGDGQGDWQVAVNLAPAESRSESIDLTRLESLGVPVGRLPDASESLQAKRQMRSSELESYQQIWRWIIVIAIGLLAIETYLAGRSNGHASISPRNL